MATGDDDQGDIFEELNLGVQNDADPLATTPVHDSNSASGLDGAIVGEPAPPNDAPEVGAKVPPDDNPFSFKKFLQGKVPSPSVDLNNSHSSLPQPPPISRDLDPDLKQEGRGSSSKKPDRDDPLDARGGLESLNKKADDNPFSFKKFLNSAPDAVVTRPKVKVNSTLANGHQLNSVFDPSVPPDLASGLPVFTPPSTLESSSSSSSSSLRADDPLRADALPDFAVDSTSAARRLSTHSSSGMTSPSTPRGASLRLPTLDGVLGGEGGAAGGVAGAASSPRSSSSPSLNEGRRDVRANRRKDEDFLEASYPQEIKEVKGRLPDFLSDAAEALNAASPGVVIDVDDADDDAAAEESRFQLPSFSSDLSSPEETRSTSVALGGEGETFSSVRKQLSHEKRKVQELERKLERLRTSDRETTDSLEKMIQNVEENLARTTRRAVGAESTNARLRDEAKEMRRRIEFLERENARLRGGGDPADDTSSQSLAIAKQIISSADNAEQMLKQLISGVTAVRTLGQSLASMQKFEDVTPDGASSFGRRGGKGAAFDRRRWDAEAESAADAEYGAVGGIVDGDVWPDFDIDFEDAAFDFDRQSK